MKPISIGRWDIDVFQRALHLTREPKPDCPDCASSGGGWMPHHLGAGWEDCHCVDQIRVWRLPLWFRRTTTEEYPF